MFSGHKQTTWSWAQATTLTVRLSVQWAQTNYLELGTGNNLDGENECSVGSGNDEELGTGNDSDGGQGD